MKFEAIITLLAIIFFTLNLSANTFENSNCRQNDSLALVAFYNNIESEFTWNFNQPMDTWQGISLNENGCVGSVILPYLSISGTIPTEINLLEELDTLNLSENFLTGEIPYSIGNLGNLSYLNLDENELSGLLPKELGNLTELSYLSLDDNSFTGIIPASFGQLANLEYLSIADNDLFGHIPQSLGDLSFLNYLNLCENRLTGLIPASFGNLTNLETLNLIENNLSGCFFEELKNICDVNSQSNDDDDDDGDGFGDNNFDASWYSFCQFNEGVCTTFDSQCRQSDSLTLRLIYENIEGLNWDLDLPVDQWEGVHLNEFGCVEGIYIYDETILNAQLVPEIGNFQFLKVLSLHCNLSGDIPEELLTGNLPSNFANLINLKILNLSGNELSGCYPYQYAKYCDRERSPSPFSNNSLNATWKDFCGLAEGICCKDETEQDIILVGNKVLDEQYYEAENTIEFRFGNYLVVSSPKNNNTVFRAQKHILIEGNIVPIDSVNLIFTVDSCK